MWGERLQTSSSARLPVPSSWWPRAVKYPVMEHTTTVSGSPFEGEPLPSRINFKVCAAFGDRMASSPEGNGLLSAGNQPNALRLPKRVSIHRSRTPTTTKHRRLSGEREGSFDRWVKQNQISPSAAWLSFAIYHPPEIASFSLSKLSWSF